MARAPLLPLAAIALAACSSSSSPGTASTSSGAGGAAVVAPAVDAGVQTNGACSKALDASRVSLPKDDASHDENMEWWYWTGHLRTADGRWFGFEEVFFRALVNNLRASMVHSAVTDIDNKKFHHLARMATWDLPRKADGFDYELMLQTAKGGNGHDVLHGEGDGYSFDLELEATKRPTLQDGDGYTDYSFGGYTYYYSRERMAAAGTLTIGGETLAVTGSGWFDHQYGDIRVAVNRGWDWFALELDDDREVMLFTVRDEKGPVVVGATLTDASCETKVLGPNDFEVAAVGGWKSPHTGCTYPQGWKVRVLDQHLMIQPYVADQEVWSSTPIYWEGAASIDGDAKGRAYVELSGYCTKPGPLTP
jgi:predicted secreted hydrolase